MTSDFKLMRLNMYQGIFLRNTARIMKIFTVLFLPFFIISCASRPLIKEFYSAEEIVQGLIKTGKQPLMIYFSFDSAKLDPSSDRQVAELPKVVLMLKQRLKTDRFKLTIIGHTDTVGEAPYNLTLSQARAHSVQTELIKRYGSEKKYLETEGRGESDLFRKPESTEEDRKYNRRVELTLMRL